MRSEHIAVVSAGEMGHGLAQMFAARGHEVALFDVNKCDREDTIIRIRSNLMRLSENGLCPREEIEGTIEQIRPAGSLKAAVADARFVVESAGGDLGAKQALFREIETFCSPITILATHTSIVSVTEIASKTKVKERIIGTHFWLPLHLIPIVEVAGGRETAREVKEYTCNILKSVGKIPVRVEKDAPGLIGNRLRHALRCEALAIVEQGIAGPEAVDEVVRKGLSILFSVSGALEDGNLDDADQTCPMPKDLLEWMVRF